MARTSGVPREQVPRQPESFVGREAELHELASALDPGSSVRLLLVHGPVGVGKTWLLRAFADRCASQGTPVAWSEQWVLEADDWTSPDAGSPPAGRRVWIHDCNASPADLDDEAIGRLLERLPPDVIVVVTSRRRPPPSIGLHPTASPRTRTLSIPTFGHDDAQILLERLGVPLSQRPTVTAFGGGSPLLLAIGAKTALEGVAGAFSPERAEDAIRGLLPRVKSGARTVMERTALRICAMARRTTPEMLASVLEDDVDVEELFTWLASQPFIDDTSEGLRMQQVARRAYLQEMRAHYPNEYLRQHRRIKEYCASQVDQSIDGHRWLACVFYLDGHISELRHYVVWEDDPASRNVEVAKASDWDFLHRGVLEHEGEESARILQYWVETVPEVVEVVRGADRAAEGLVVTLPVEGNTAPVHARTDPALEVVRGYVETKGVSDEAVWGILHRYWMDLRTYQSPSPVLTQILTHMVARGIGIRNVPFTFAVTRDAQAWLRLTRILEVPAEHAGQFDLNGRAYALVAVDWRDLDRGAWLHRFARRQVDKAGPTWWKRVFGGDRTSGRCTLRETLRPGVAESAAPWSSHSEDTATAGGLGDLIMSHMRALAHDADLTKREMEVLDLLLLGRNTEEVALVLDISPRTAKFHQSNVLRKLGADSKADLVRLLL
ncbi:MAG: LuxR C-terminal-related transcriptional regulator [Myxococcota bacterium]